MLRFKVLGICLLLITTSCIGTVGPKEPKIVTVDRKIVCFAGAKMMIIEGATVVEVDLKDKEFDKTHNITAASSQPMKDGSLDWAIYFQGPHNEFTVLLNVKFNDEIRINGFMDGTFTFSGIYNSMGGKFFSEPATWKAQVMYYKGNEDLIQDEIARRKAILD